MAAVRACKVVECGLEVPRGVVYQGWEPGGEYTKLLVMKNVQLRTQRIKYKIKGDQFHSAVYPRPIVLSAGMSYTLPIVFKPNRKESCEQSIELETAEGAIAIPLKAVLPRVLVSLPESLKFGLCAVQDSLSLEFQISNTSSVGTQFSWECPSKCFTVSPTSGSLGPRSSCKLSATFTPESAKVYSVTATCSYGKEGEEGERKSVELKGVGKYPHVVVRLPRRADKNKGREGSGRDGAGKTRCARGIQEKVEEEGSGVIGGVMSGGEDGGSEVQVVFGSVAVGTSAEKWIELVNVSAVPATFSIVPVSHSRLSPAHFTCPQPPSPLPPHSSHRLPLTFSPSLPSPHSAFAFFEVKIQGGLATTTVKCIGVAKAPKVVIEEEVLSFGNVACGQSTTVILHVKNCSDVTALFQLQLETGSVFHADSTCMKLPPNSSHKLPVHFTPRKPVPHCKRVACLVQHQEPLFVHLIGSAHSETVRPVVLQPKHVTEYVLNAQTGVSKLPPERLAELVKEGKLSVDKSTGLLQPVSSDSCLPGRDASGEVPVSSFANYLHSHHEPSGIAHVSMDSDSLQFGCVPPHCVSDGKTLHVTNHTEGTLCCVWMTGSGGVFSVAPEEREIAPGTTCLFTAHFKPIYPGQFHFEELECFVFYKCLQDYQSVVESGVVTPPWCLCVRAQGHSFHTSAQTFTPRLDFETRDVVFPASGPLEPAYRSMTVWNNADTPALFEMNPDPNQIFTIKPLSGLIPKGQYQTFMLEMLPRDAKTYKHITHCVLNASDNYTQELLLSGTAEVSPVLLENQGRLFFKPTCVGATSLASYKITSTAQLPLRFEWKVSGEGSEVIAMEPRHGVILPSESQIHQWQFSPRGAAPLAVKAVLHTSVEGEGQGIRGSSSHKRRHKAVLDLFGQGLHGEVQCRPSHLQFGTVVMGTSHTHTLTLLNPSLCTLHYSLHVHHDRAREQQQQQQQRKEEEEEEEEEEGYRAELPHGVELDPCEGVLHARSSQTVHVTVRPTVTSLYSCVVSCHLITTNPAVAAPASSILCRLDITGAYPSLVVTDVHGLEAANGVSKTRLWDMLSIDRLNSHLCEDPSASELRYAIATRHSMRRRVSVYTHAVEAFHFGAAPLGSGCSTVHLVMRNTGKVDTQWGFQFPSDMNMEPEYWAESGALDEVERHHHDIISNQLFTVTPKTGTLAPGQSVSVLCSFKHTHIGTSKLPVLLKIHRGREILLNWTGVTVERGTPHMFFTSHHHCLQPVPIGATSYPTQSYELHNAGESAVSYEVDTAPLLALTQSSYLMPILQCLCPQGDVPPRGSAALSLVFSPLEAKRYSVDLPITFSTGESVLLTLSGEGYDPHTPPPDTHTTHTTQTSVSRPPLTSSSQLAVISTEHLSLGALPLFSPVRRLVFLSNLHSSHTVSFSWSLSSAAAAAEVLSIYPAEGYVEAGQSCACRVTFYSHSSPASYDVDIICKVVDESEMVEYRGRLEQWAARQEEGRHTFTVSHPTLARRSRNTDKQGHPQTIPKQQSVLGSTDRPRSSDSDLRGSRYRVLPPIGAQNTDTSYDDWKKQDLSVRSKARRRAATSSDDEPPSPPTPLLLHLGLTAHTHSLTDYANTFGDLDIFYIDPQTQISPHKEKEMLVMKAEERDLILSVLGQMARELLDDSNFHTALERVQHEPVPYFTQLTSPHTDTGTDTQIAAHTDTDTAEHTDTGIDGDVKSQLTGTGEERSKVAKRVSQTWETKSEADSLRGEREGETFDEITPEGTLNSDSDMSAIKRLPEMQCLLEGILENTLLNIVRESEAGEFGITAPLYLVADHTRT